MSDVREQLLTLMQCGSDTETYEGFVDAVLERFDVKPKPVVSDWALGVMLWKAYLVKGFHDVQGRHLKGLLDEAGMEIVRKDEVAS